jgi:hypothetical protein
MKKHYLIAAMGILCVPALAFAAPWPTVPSGSCDNFDWANGQNVTDVWGEPTNSGDNMYFFPGFSAYADDTSPAASPGTHAVTDTFDVDFIAHAGMHFGSISIYVYGDYSIADGGVAGGNSVEGDFGIQGTDNDGLHPDSPWARAQALFQETAVGGANWNDLATMTIDFSGGNEVTDLHLTCDGTVTAISDGEGGTAAITANVALLTIAVEVIPEPASLLLLGLGGLAVLRRR